MRDPLAGETVGPYRIDRTLGRGQHGVVYSATQVASNRQVALKVLSAEECGDTASRRRITRTVQGVASVCSPYVARVHLYGEHDSRLFVASELVAGGDLAKVLAQRGAAPVLPGLDLMTQVAAGLAAVHERGLVHGAVTPTNVLVRWRGDRLVGMLADAGSGHHVTAPEVHEGAEASVASDVHSLGALVWHTLVGEPPHPGTPYQAASGFVRDAVPRLAGSSPRVVHLNALLARAMHPDPGRRHESALALRDDLLAAMELPGEPGPLERAAHPPAGLIRATLVAVVVVCLTVMVAGLVAGAALLGNA